jgi:peptidoglycan hydrolase CwlO-like protein
MPTENIDQLKKTLTAFRQEVDDIDFRIEELQDEKEDLESEIDDLEEKIEELEDAELEEVAD